MKMNPVRVGISWRVELADGSKVGRYLTKGRAQRDISKRVEIQMAQAKFEERLDECIQQGVNAR